MKPLIKKEADVQALFHGAFSYYSDLRLGESPRALVLTEFQTGRGKRIDMLVHGIKFADQDSNAKEYMPVGLELKGPREGEEVGALKDEANKQINNEYKTGVTYKTLTDGREVGFVGVVFDKGANDAHSLIQLSNEKEFIPVKVVHSSVLSLSQCVTRKRRNIGITCIDSLDKEKITEKEKKQRIKELFSIDNTKDLTNEIINIGYDEVFDMIGNGYRTDVYVTVKGNDGHDKKLIIGDTIEMKSARRYFVDESDHVEILVKVGRNKDHVIIEEIKGQDIGYYLSIDGYKVKLDDIIKGFTTDTEREVIYNTLHQLSNDKQLLENKKYIEDIGDVQDIGTSQDYNDIVREIKQKLLAKGVWEDTFERFKSHFDDLSEKVFVKYIYNVEENLNEKGIAFDPGKFESAKIKGAKGGKFFSLMAIYDLLDSIGDTATFGQHNNDALKQAFGINGILDAMDDVRTSVSISPDSKIGRLISKVPQSTRQTFVKIISNPVVQSITFATIAYQFGYSVDEIARGNHHPLNYYWTASSGVKLASMSIRPISVGVNFTIKSVSATTKILRGLSVASKVLSRAAVVTMVADVLITMGIEIYERIEYTKAIAEQVPLLPGNEQAEVFFAKVISFFTTRDVEKEYEDKIRIKSYLNYVKEVAIKLLNDDYNIAAVVQYVVSIEEKYSEMIINTGRPYLYYTLAPGASVKGWACGLERKYKDISFSEFDIASNVERNLSSIDISKVLTMTPYTLVISEGLERLICTIKNSPQCYQEMEKEKVYVINTDAKHIPHLTKYEYENLGLRIVDAPLGGFTQRSQCSKIINKKHTNDTDINELYPCNTDKIYRNCQEAFTLSGRPFIFTNPKRKNHDNTKKQTFPRGSVLYISGPKILTAAANYPALMRIPEGNNIRYIGSQNNETIFVISKSASGTLKGGVGKENTVVMNVEANNIVTNLHSGTIHYGNNNNIRLVNTYNYVSNSESKQNITTHCETRLINVKNAEVWQNSFHCTDKDYEFREVNKENIHHRGLKQTIFIVNEGSDNARIVSDLDSTKRIKGNIDVIKVQVNNIKQWGISRDIERGCYSLDLFAGDMQTITSSTKIDDFKNLVIQVNCQGIIQSVAIQDKSLSDTIEDIRYQKLRNSGSGISREAIQNSEEKLKAFIQASILDREAIQNSEKKLKAFIQASILDQESPSTYQVAKDIINNNNLDIPVSQVEVTKNHMGVPNEKVIIADTYSDQVIVDFSYNNSDVTSSHQKYRDNGGSHGYNDYMMLCNYYQGITVEGEKKQHQYIIKLPGTLIDRGVESSPIRLNLKIENEALPYQSMLYSIIDFTELNVTDIDSVNIQEGARSYINECYKKSISDLTEDSLEIKDITILDSKGTKWSLSIGLVDYLQSLEHQQIVLRMNNELYKIDGTDLRLKHVEMNPNSFRYYQPEEQGLQIYHNQPVDKNDVGLVDFRDKSILGFDTEIIDDSLVLLYKNNTLAKVENWNTYKSAREMMFAFNDTMVSNLKCIFSACNSGDIIEDFNKEKVTLLKEKMFDAIVRDNVNEAIDLIRKIENINNESRHELALLYIAIQSGRLDVVKILFEKKYFNVKDKDVNGYSPLHWAIQAGNLNIAKFLVDKGADVSVLTTDGRTLYDLATDQDYREIREYLRSKSAVPSLKILNNLSRISTFGMCESNSNLCGEAIKEVLDKIYEERDTESILEFIHNGSNITQSIQGYIAVFDAMRKRNELNKNTVFKLSYYIKEIMERGDLVPEDRSDLEGLIRQLPKSVKNVVFASEVCIKNVGYGEYLYVPLLPRLQVFTLRAETHKDFPHVKDSWKIELDDGSYRLKHVGFGKYLRFFDYAISRVELVNIEDMLGNSVGVWKFEADGDNVYMMGVQIGKYLCAGSGSHHKYIRRLYPCDKDSQNQEQDEDIAIDKWKVEDCGSTRRDDIVKPLEAKPSRERGRRKRRHHHGDHNRHHNRLSRQLLTIDSSNQPEIAASSGTTRPSSWINNLFGWVKSSVSGLLSSKPRLSDETSSTPSPISQVDAPVDINGTIMLLDLLIRKVTGQKYISTVDQSISPLEAQGYALNITKGFEKVVEQAGLKSGVSMHRLNIDYMGMQKDIVRKVVRGQFNEISGVLSSYLEKACPNREAGCPGKLSSKKFDKFIAQFNNGLLNQSIEHNRDGRLEVDGAKQMNLEPQSYLNNASVYSHSEVSNCLSEIGVTKLGGNLNR